MSEGQEDKRLGQLLENRFRVTKPLGQGGMGSVYKGRDEHRQLDVAVKFLHEDTAKDENEVKRFKQEALLLNQLDHDNVVHVFAFGVLPGVGPYVILEYFAGEGLDAMIERRGRIPVSETTDWLMQVCEGLAHAHELGVLHRDLKPSNLMVVDDGPKRLMKILDFGIAKNMSMDKAMSLTRKGEVFGSPLYMSPEQCQAQEVDPRSDIYSIGCVAYEMLTGQPPLVADSWLGTVVKHVTEMPVPPHSVDPSIPESLANVVMRCLMKDKSQRYQSTIELREDIRSVASLN